MGAQQAIDQVYKIIAKTRAEAGPRSLHFVSRSSNPEVMREIRFMHELNAKMDRAKKLALREERREREARLLAQRLPVEDGEAVSTGLP